MRTFTTRKTMTALALALALAPLALSACGSDSSQSSSPTGGLQLIEHGKLTVCTHLSYKPFEFKDSSGKVVGFDMDLAEAAAKQMDATVKIVDIDFASMTSGAVFAANKCDLAMGAITITDERKQTVNFSEPYFSATQALLVKKASGISDLSGLDGKNLGVQTDTTGQLYAEKQQAANGYEPVVFDDLSTELGGVQSGRVDGVINDNGPLLDFSKSNPDFAVVKEFDTGEQYGFMGQKGDADATKIMDAFNKALATAVSDGTYEESYQKWFDSKPAVMPKIS